MAGSLIKDFNFNPLPSTITFRNDLNRTMDETKVRVVGDGGYQIPATYYKNFLWLRTYSLRWELTRSLSMDYAATNTSRIDEPYGRIDSKEKRDSLWDAVSRFGRNTLFQQQANANYTVPLGKLPITDWITLRLGYSTTYTWSAASQLARSLGNTIANTQGKTLNGELNFQQLYNKSRYLRAVNAPKGRGQTRPNSLASRAGASSSDRPDGKPGVDKPATPDMAEGRDGSATGTPSTGAASEAAAATGKSKNNKRPAVLNLKGVAINTVNMSDAQLDSVRRLIRADEIAQAKAAKAKKKAERKLARKNRKKIAPQLSPVERTVGQILTMVKRTTVSYTESGGTILPGYLDSTQVFGINTANGKPGVGFAFGQQVGGDYLERLAANGKLSHDSLFNAQFQQTHQQSLNITAQIEPIPNDLRIDLSLTKSFSKSHNELFKDTGFNGIYTPSQPLRDRQLQYVVHRVADTLPEQRYFRRRGVHAVYSQSPHALRATGQK